MADPGEYSEDRFTDLFEGDNGDRAADSQTIPFVGHPIAERLAALHGGSLRHSPSESHGTIVTLRLPIRQLKSVAEKQKQEQEQLVEATS